MKKYLVITIDVEPDCTPTWHYSDPLEFKGVTEGVKKRLQPLFNKYGMVPTYLINNVVMEDPESVKTFLGLDGRFELGTHLHCEFIEPEKVFHSYNGKKGEANQCELTPEIELGKMRSLTRLFEDKFNRKPFSFRAGRFSAGENTIRCLKELGYKVDTSVTPYVKWHDKTRSKPVDYSSAPGQPYYINDSAFPSPSPVSPILEVPVTIRPRSVFFRKKPQWLRPYYSDYGNFISITNWVQSKYPDNEMVVYNMMLHNVEVMPGLSPYSQTESDCKKYLDSMEKYFAYCRNSGIEGVSLSGLADLNGKK